VQLSDTGTSLTIQSWDPAAGGVVPVIPAVTYQLEGGRYVRR
jgi:hypothetical protein